MYKPLLTLLAVSLTLTSFGQQKPQLAPGADKAVPNATTHLTGNEIIGTVANKPQPEHAYAKAINEEIIGETIYDLQSNGAVQNRNVVYSDGTIAAAFTKGDSPSSFTDRGTGYNYFSSGAWDAWPLARIETTRNGWPSLMGTYGGNEIVISHSGSGSFTMNKRSPKGTGTWVESLVPSSIGHWLLWPRAATGGASGNSIHLIGITAPVANGGTKYQGIDGALLYFRSEDEGATWNVTDMMLPGIDSTVFNSFSGDSYSIISSGDNVAIAVYNQWADMVLFKSTDNGTTWTSQIIMDFPLDLYVPDQPGGSDTNGDMVADTISTNDGAGSIVFDNSGMVHLTVGHMRVLDDDLTDGNTSYFPGTMELLYWNESMGMGVMDTIAYPEDTDSDGQLGFNGEYALYYVSLCGFPSMGVSPSGTIYVSYSGYMENFGTATQNSRHIYVMKSNDNGGTWTTPFDVTPDLLGYNYEYVFADMAPNVDNKVRIVYQRDYEPGLAVRGDMDTYDINHIMYLDVDTTLVDDTGIDEITEGLLDAQVYPNPSDEVVTLSLEMESAQDVTIAVMNINGQETLISEELSLTEGTHEHTLNTAQLATGVYYISIEINGDRMIKKLVVQH